MNATERVSYLDYDAKNGVFTNAVAECSFLTDTSYTLWDGGWYAVTNAVTISKGNHLVVNGSAHLILCDGASLTILKSEQDNAGIEVEDQNSLTIYGQEAGTGVLTSTGGLYSAGIGGGYTHKTGAADGNCGTVTINGGTVKAIGGTYCAGIGGGYQGSGGTVTINGGTVTAKTGSTSLAGAGIGGGYKGNGYRVSITGGAVCVEGGTNDIGGGDGLSTTNGEISVSGGIFAREPQNGWLAEDCCVVSNADEATQAEYPWKVMQLCKVTVGDFLCGTVAWTSGDGSVTNVVDGTAFKVARGTESVKVIFTAKPGCELVGEPVVNLGTVMEDMAIDANQLPKVLPVTIGMVATNIPWNDAEGKITLDYALAGLDSDTLYKVAFDITADGRTAGVTNEAAKLSDGRQPLQTIKTVKLFGRKVTDKEATIKVSLIAVNPPDGQLWQGGPIWAECNLGADRPEESGWYFWWGDTVGYTNNGSAWVSVADGSSTIRFSETDSSAGSTYQKTRAELTDEGWIDANGNLVSAHDAATVKLGAPWRMMTAAELQKLVDPNVCKIEWTEDYNGTGVGGYLVSGVTVGYTHKSIFLPAVGWGLGDTFYGTFGYYMSSSLPSDDADSYCQYACDFRFSSTQAPVQDKYYRYAGLTVRPVKDAETSGESLVAFAQKEFRLGPGGESCPWTVTVGEHPHMTAAWTSGDGAVTNVIDGTSFRVTEEVGNVTVIFTAEPGREIVGDAVVNIGTVDRDISFGEGFYKVPRAVLTETIAYLDRDAETGAFTNAVRTCEIVETSTLVLESGWYAVTGGVEIPAGTNLTVAGDVHLVLCDGSSLTIAEPGEHAAGIAVVGANRLTIYGQEAGTGVLTAQGGEYCAGIGGYVDGSYIEPDFGTVTILGGTVVATGGAAGSGIGCSPRGCGGHVAIHGGTVTATGGTGGTGIDCCSDALGPQGSGVVEITGGKVTATGRKDFNFSHVAISGGVFGRRPEDGWCAEHFAVFANADPATCGDYPYAVLPSRTVTVGARPAHMAAAWTDGDGTETNAIDGASFAVSYGSENVRVVFTAEAGWEIVGDAVVDLGTVTDDIAFGGGNDYRVPEVRYLLGDIPYLYWDGTQMARAALPKYVFTIVTDETREMSSGWYAVTNDVVLPNGGNIKVTGDVRLVLCDTASLTITNATGRSGAAIDVPETASLTIYGQEAGTGALVAHGGTQAAGIGGGAPTSLSPTAGSSDFVYGHCGTVTIHGGTVVATGGMLGAGIGGGFGGDGGTVTVRGGTVTATGSDGGAGIGGGAYSGNGGRVTIFDGAISAAGGANMEGIGPGTGYIGGALMSCIVEISGGIFARKPQSAWLKPGFAAVANQDAATVAAYPWVIVPWPAAWPEADDAVKAKFDAWRNGVGADADLTTEAAKTAFLLNVAEKGIRTIRIKALQIESIDVDSEGYSTIVVSAPRTLPIDRIDLGNINGVLYVHAGDTLDAMEPKSVAYWTTPMGKANIRVKARFVRAAIGFKTPEEVKDTVLPEQKDPE